MERNNQGSGCHPNQVVYIVGTCSGVGTTGQGAKKGSSVAIIFIVNESLM